MLSPKNISIPFDRVSEILRERWIACYMLYDSTPLHAAECFSLNQIECCKKVCSELEYDFKIDSDFGTHLTETYNRILAEDIEDFILTHTEVMKCSRSDVELCIAKKLAGSV